jgi:hypothetical protein
MHERQSEIVKLLEFPRFFEVMMTHCLVVYILCSSSKLDCRARK